MTSSDYTTPIKLLELRGYPEGWHYGEGCRFDEKTIATASQLAKIAFYEGIYDSDIFPGTNGEIMLSFYRDKHYLELIVEPSEIIQGTYEIDDEVQSILLDMDLEEATNQIRRFSTYSRLF